MSLYDKDDDEVNLLRNILQNKIGKVMFVQSDTDAHYMMRFISRCAGFICMSKTGELDSKFVFYCRDNDTVLNLSSGLRTGSGEKYEDLGYRTGITSHLKHVVDKLPNEIPQRYKRTAGDFRKTIRIYDMSSLSNATKQAIWSFYSHSYVLTDATLRDHMAGIIEGSEICSPGIKDVTSVAGYEPEVGTWGTARLAAEYSLRYALRETCRIL
jgi:hypothetical protein